MSKCHIVGNLMYWLINDMLKMFLLSISDFQFGPNFDVTPEMKSSFDQNGFVIIR